MGVVGLGELLLEVDWLEDSLEPPDINLKAGAIEDINDCERFLLTLVLGGLLNL